RLPVVQQLGGQGLGGLLQGDNQHRQGQPEPGPRRRKGAPQRGHQANLLRAPPPSTLSMQRPHSSGCSLWVPTSGRKCQQRTHFRLLEATTPTRSPFNSEG